MSWVDPFSKLPKEVSELLVGLRSREVKADAEFDALVTQYKDLLEDTRYTKIKQRVISELATELRLLVDEAVKVPGTASRATRIKILERLVNDPLEVLWLDDQQKSLASNVDQE